MFENLEKLKIANALKHILHLLPVLGGANQAFVG